MDNSLVTPIRLAHYFKMGYKSILTRLQISTVLTKGKSALANKGSLSQSGAVTGAQPAVYYSIQTFIGLGIVSGFKYYLKSLQIL